MDVIGIDEMPCLDFLMQVPHIPGTNGVVFAQRQSWQGGGKVATAMVTCARLGVSAGLIGSVGDDAPGRFLRRDLERHGVNTTHLSVGGTTSISVALAETETEGRSFIGARGRYEALALTDAHRRTISGAKYLHLSKMTSLTVSAAEYAKAQGVTVVFDADAYSAEIWDNMHLIDVLIASEYFVPDAFRGWEAACDLLLARGPDTVVITLGGQGCVGKGIHQPYFELPAFRGLPIVDTTGAGDVYHGAYIAGMLKGMDMPACARFASAVAYIKCGYQGGRAGIPDSETVARFLREGVLNTRELDARAAFYACCPL